MTDVLSINSGKISFYSNLLVQKDNFLAKLREQKNPFFDSTLNNERAAIFVIVNLGFIFYHASTVSRKLVDVLSTRLNFDPTKTIGHRDNKSFQFTYYDLSYASTVALCSYATSKMCGLNIGKATLLFSIIATLGNKILQTYKNKDSTKNLFIKNPLEEYLKVQKSNTALREAKNHLETDNEKLRSNLIKQNLETERDQKEQIKKSLDHNIRALNVTIDGLNAKIKQKETKYAMLLAQAQSNEENSKKQLETLDKGIGALLYLSILSEREEKLNADEARLKAYEATLEESRRQLEDNKANVPENEQLLNKGQEQLKAEQYLLMRSQELLKKNQEQLETGRKNLSQGLDQLVKIQNALANDKRKYANLKDDLEREKSELAERARLEVKATPPLQDPLSKLSSMSPTYATRFAPIQLFPSASPNPSQPVTL